MIRFAASFVVAAGSLATSSASAVGLERYSGFGVKAGLANVEGLGTTATAGVFTDFGVLPNALVTIGADAWQMGGELPETGAVSVRDITGSVFAKYVIPVKSTSVRPFAGAGGAWHAVQVTPVSHGAALFAPDGGERSHTRSGLGIDFGAGAVIAGHLGSNFLGELRYRRPPGGDLKDAVSDQMTLTAGYMAPF